MERLAPRGSLTTFRAAALLAVIVLATAAGNRGGRGFDDHLQVVMLSGTADASFVIRGDVDGLYPGRRTTLEVHVENPNIQPIRVLWISVTVQDASAACLASNVTVRNYRQSFVVPGGGAVVISRSLHIRRRAPDTCQGATFPLVYRGMAVKP